MDFVQAKTAIYEDEPMATTKSSQVKTKVMKNTWHEDVKARREETKASSEKTQSYPERSGATVKVGQRSRKAKIKTDFKETYATEPEASQEETEAVSEHQEVANEDAAVKIIGAPKDCSGDQEQAVGCRNLMRKRTQDKVRGAPKGRIFKKRRRTHPECINGIRD
jgi:hypothetical protein